MMGYDRVAESGMLVCALDQDAKVDRFVASFLKSVAKMDLTGLDVPVDPLAYV